MNLLGLPVGANPDRDIPWGTDELGNPQFRASNGTIYSIRQNAIPQRQTEPGTLARAGEVGKEYIGGAIQSLFDAVTAPRRALSGEGVTYGDALNTAGMLQLGGAASMGRGVMDYDPTVNRIFAGPKAKTANLDALAKAKHMSASGTNADDIWSQTGWFKLPDGQWRFEIMDQDVGLRRPGEAAQIGLDMRQQAKDIRSGIKQRNANLKVQPDLFPQTLRKAHGILAREADALERSAGGNYGPEWNPETIGQRATYALTDSELQRAYPELMNETIVRTEQNMGSALGGYTEGLDRLDLAPSARIAQAQNAIDRDPRSILLHELQHGVQGVEGFARGSNPSAAAELLRNQRDKAIGDTINARAAVLRDASQAEKHLFMRRVEARQNADLEALDTVNAELAKLPNGPSIIAADDAAAAAAAQAITPEIAMEAYRNHLGEVESRLVQERMSWDAQKRKATPPWRMEQYPDESSLIKSFDVAPTRPKDVFANVSPEVGLLATQPTDADKEAILRYLGAQGLLR